MKIDKLGMFLLGLGVGALMIILPLKIGLKHSVLVGDKIIQRGAFRHKDIVYEIKEYDGIEWPEKDK